jgi:hypothetical protein
MDLVGWKGKPGHSAPLPGRSHDLMRATCQVRERKIRPHEHLSPMIDAAFYILSAALVIGAGLAIFYMRGAEAKPPHWIILLAHGGLGAAGLIVLLASLRRGLPATGMGISGFGPAAAGLFALALALGLMLAGASWRNRRPAGALVGAHATCAIAGFVVLLALIALR